MKILSKIPPTFKNKYFLISTGLLVWMLFFDPKDILSNINKGAKLKELQKSERHLTSQITDTQKELELLKTNTLTIEKYAREKYMMKKDNEDLFIINTPQKTK